MAEAGVVPGVAATTNPAAAAEAATAAAVAGSVVAFEPPRPVELVSVPEGGAVSVPATNLAAATEAVTAAASAGPAARVDIRHYLAAA